MPGAPLPPKPSTHLITPPTGPSSIIPGFLNAGITGIPRGPQNVSRKRSYNDREEPDSSDSRNIQSGGDVNGRFFKQARRGSDIGRGGRFDNYGTSRGLKQGQPSPMQMPQMPVSGFSNLPAITSPPPRMPPLDPNNPMAALLAMQTLGFPLPGMSPFPQATSPLGQSGSPAPGYSTHKKAQRCRDYDTKGFCARGNTCMFEHGTDSIYMPPNIVEGKPIP
jgi:RNA-binding protein 26